MNKWHVILAAAVCTSAVIVPTAEASSTSYTVQKGDTLSKIATKYNVTVAQLKSWNSLTSNTIYVNQKLVVKKTSTIEAKESTKIEETSSSVIKTYKVVKGDTLSKVATKYGTTVSNIKKWNALTSDIVEVNELLIVSKSSTLISLTTPTPSTSNSNVSEEPSTTAQTVDAMIAKQLASETIITKNPNGQAQQKYADIIAEAKKYIGVPYVFGGSSPAGFDCSGFISYLFNEAGVKIARKTSLNYFLQDTVVVKNPVPGDLVFFKNTYIPTVSHMGIYIGNGEIIHASSGGVEITKLSYKYWADRQIAIKRFKQLQ